MATCEITPIYHVYNHASFHLWWKGNFVKHQTVSKYYENNCRSIYVVSMWIYFCFVLIFIMINCIISWIQTCLFFCIFLRICPVLLDDNVNEECEYFSSVKNSTWGCCLAFAWFFTNFSLALRTKVLIIKKSVKWSELQKNVPHVLGQP